MDKKIKESKRGLTFSFTPTETMQIGSRYDYIISNSGIRIVPSENGSLYRVAEEVWLRLEPAYRPAKQGSARCDCRHGKYPSAYHGGQYPCFG